MGSLLAVTIIPTIFFIFIIWNLFAVIGMVVTLKYFIEKYSKKGAKKEKEKVVSKEQNIKQQKEERSAKSQPKEKREVTKPKFDTSSLLLYTGAFLVGFSTFIFVAFNWESFSDGVKALMISGIVILFYILGYLFSLKKEYAKVSKTFIFLASISVAFAGIGIWKFYIEDKIPSLRAEDFGFIYSIFLTVVYALTYMTYRSKVYFIFGLTATYATLLYSAPALISEEKYQIPYLLLISIGLYVTTSLIFENRRLYEKIAVPVMRGVVLIFNIATISLIADSLFSITTLEEKFLSIASLLASYIMIFFLHRSKGSVRFEPIVEGLLLPLKVFLILSVLIIDAGSYQFLGASLFLFVISVLLSLTRFYKIPTIKAFTIPLIISSAIASLILPMFKPIYVQDWDPLPMAISYLTLSVGVQIKSYPEKYSWGRLLNIPLDMIAFIMLMLAVDQRLDLGLDKPYVMGLLLLIPGVVYAAEWILTTSTKKIPLLLGSLVFLTTSTLLALEDPLFLFVITAIGVFYYFVVLINSKKALFTIPLMFYAFFNATAAFMYVGYDADMWILSLVGLLIFFGNLWRFKHYFKFDQFWFKVFKYFQYASLFFLIPVSGLLFILTFESDTLITPLIALLLSLFTLSVFGNRSWPRYLTGIGFTLAFWWLIQRSDTPIYANAQAYVFPIMIYMLILAFVIYPKKKWLGELFKTTAYLLPMTVALVQSITDPEPYNLYHGLLLITVSSVLVVYGAIKKDKLLFVLSVVYIVTELFILLWDLILSIPWWIYLGMLGMVLIGMSVWIIYKITNKSGKN